MGDELLDVVRFEASYTSWFPLLGGWGSGCGGVGQLAEQLLQGFYLAF